MTSSDMAGPAELDGAIDTIEETYEFMLAYAAQGRRADEDKSGTGIRAYLERAEAAMAVIARAGVTGEAASQFLEIVKGDVAKARAAFRFVLAQPVISSQLIDNLNASSHVRALLTDMFLLDEALKLTVS